MRQDNGSTQTAVSGEVASIAVALAAWRPCWSMWSVCRERVDGELEPNDARMRQCRESLQKAMARVRLSSMRVGKFQRLIASFSWSQIQHLVAWADCGFDDEEAARLLGLDPSSIAGALDYARTLLADGD